MFQVPKSGSVRSFSKDRSKKFLNLVAKDWEMLEFACHNIGFSFFRGRAIKGKSCSKHSVESDPQTPHINEFRIIMLFSDDFRSSIGGCSTYCLSELALPV